ncbi:MAG: hypothetical protein LC781_09685 [Actinobacteria bacterium]|nr:hypothetical protein [Actinomycetota bacterium]
MTKPTQTPNAALLFLAGALASALLLAAALLAVAGVLALLLVHPGFRAPYTLRPVSGRSPVCLSRKLTASMLVKPLRVL